MSRVRGRDVKALENEGNSILKCESRAGKENKKWVPLAIFQTHGFLSFIQPI